jgi:hypothetical protein
VESRVSPMPPKDETPVSPLRYDLLNS